MDGLIKAFEDLYTKVYVHGAEHSQAGYQILGLGLISSVPKPMPEWKKFKTGAKKPSPEAHKGKREVCVKGAWKTARLPEMDEWVPGNEMDGLSIIEAPATTMPVPEGKRVVIDEYRRYGLEDV